MSGPTPPDPTASAEEWAEARPAVRRNIDLALEREQGVRYRDCGENSRMTAVARRVLADAPALLARLREAEGLLREARTWAQVDRHESHIARINRYFAAPAQAAQAKGGEGRT